MNMNVKMNGYTDTYRHSMGSKGLGHNPSPPLPFVQRFPSSPSIDFYSYSHPDSPSDTDTNPYSRFDFDFDFGYTGSPLSSKSSSPQSLAPSPLSLARPRKAPLPPVYSPRRARARHIRMQEPAKLGLFTVSEEEIGESSSSSTTTSVDEDVETETETEWYCDLSTPITYSPSSYSTSTSTSTSPSLSGSESEIEVETPNGEFDDPFSTPPTTLSITSPFTRPRPPPPTLRTVVPVPTLAAAVNAGTFQPRRPPPLELHLITRPRLDIDSLSLSPSPLTFHCQLSSAGGLPLAAALPIRESPISISSCTTPQKRRSPDSEVDLVSALEELFTSCGEDLDDVDKVESPYSIGVDDFPLPPSRSITSMSVSKSKSRSLNTSPSPTIQCTPVTPPPTRLSLSPGNYQPPAAPRQKSRRVDTRTRTRGPRLEGNHSFLLDMARSPSSSSSSSTGSGSGSSSGSHSSSTSGRSLPRRGSIPVQWSNVV
jgi:hypothetical protein